MSSINSSNVVSLKEGDLSSPATSLARVAEIRAEGDEKNARLLQQYAAKGPSIAEKLKVLDAEILATARVLQFAVARWQAFADLEAHSSPLGWRLPVGLCVLFGGEIFLSATVLSGLDLPTWQQWLVAGGCAAGGTLGVEGLALAARGVVSDRHDHIPVSKIHIVLIYVGFVSLLVSMLGQFFARESYSTMAAEAAGDSGVSWMVAAALTLLQLGLYGGAWFALYQCFPNPRLQQAFNQVQKTRAHVHKLHHERAKLSGRLNTLVFDLRAAWAANNAYSRSLMLCYVQERKNGNDPSVASTLINEAGLTIPDWVTPAPEIGSIVAVGPCSADEMAKAEDRRLALLLGTAFNTPANVPPAQTPVFESPPEKIK